MKAKDQVSFYDAVRVMDLESLENIREILLDKKMSKDSIAKLKMIDIAIEEKQRRKEYVEKL
ncbi:hypothetical protein [uncultured Anaerococcus sp.]|uniref:hypothetical protein n=1 Tax=uncultured Anaerococcus sp. TaxID=293428 RepID=UPI0025FAE534|nr:hypothetical protein [uncultured Anaerococcus sp.]